MWQSPSHRAQSSSHTSETAPDEEEGDSPAIFEDSPNNDISPNSPGGPLLCSPRAVTASLVSELSPKDSQLQMGSDIQSRRLRGHRKRTYASTPRVRPYTLPGWDPYNESSSEHCIGENLASNSGAQTNNAEESPLRLLTKTSDGNQDLEDIYENDNNLEIVPNLSTSLDFSENNLDLTADSTLVSSELDQYNDSFETFTQSLSELRLDSGYLSPSSVNDSLGPDEELSLIPLIGSEETRKELYELNSKCIFDIPAKISLTTKPLLHLNDPIISLHRKVIDLPMPTTKGQKLANNLIKLSRHLKCPDLTDLCCLNCSCMPVQPVTGKCGHTRCMSCIEANGACPCGVSAPKELSVNTVIREITEKMSMYIKKSRIIDPGSFRRTSHVKTCPLTGANRKYLVKRQQSHSSQLLYPNASSSTQSLSRPRMPMTVQARHNTARQLVKDGKYLEASSHLVRVAASSESGSRFARTFLAKTISAMYEEGGSSISRKLCQSVREQAVHSWLRPGDLECVLCTSTYSKPVTTPCGHTYCRACMERCMYYRKKCALCLNSLADFSLEEIGDTIFISSILASIDVAPIHTDTVVIPIMTCYVAFPGMPCPLLMMDRNYWLMVSRELESGTRRFGMLAYERGHTFADYGTVLEICDCVLFENNRCIVSSIGVSRFRVIERFQKDGFDVARVQPLTDITPTKDEAQNLHMLAVQIYCKAIEWLKAMDDNVREEIETAFGTLPYDDKPEELGRTLDGPNWLWWLIAILPLKVKIQILILSTRSLLKRMLAVSRTLDAMDSNFTSYAVSEELANPADWLARDG